MYLTIEEGVARRTAAGLPAHFCTPEVLLPYLKPHPLVTDPKSLVKCHSIPVRGTKTDLLLFEQGSGKIHLRCCRYTCNTTIESLKAMLVNGEKLDGGDDFVFVYVGALRVPISRLDINQKLTEMLQ